MSTNIIYFPTETPKIFCIQLKKFSLQNAKCDMVRSIRFEPISGATWFDQEGMSMFPVRHGLINKIYEHVSGAT
jgi:hypothetical protein